MKLIFNRFGLLLIAGLMLGAFAIIYSNDMQAKEKSILMKNPVFQLKIDTFGTRFIAKINGTTVFTETSTDSQLVTSIPLNQWLSPESNDISLKVYPEKKGQSLSSYSHVYLSLLISESGSAKETKIDLIHYQGSGYENGKEIEDSIDEGSYSLVQPLTKSDNGDFTLTTVSRNKVAGFEGAMQYQRSFTMSSNLPLWKFFSSDDLPDYYSMDDDGYYKALEDIYSVYEKLQTAFEEKDIDTILVMTDERSKETDLAFYREPGTTADNLKSSLERDFVNTELTLEDLKSEYLGIELHDNKKLVELNRKNTPAIVYSIQGGGSTGYPFVLRRKDGQWIVTR